MKRIFWSVVLVALAVVAVFALLWWIGVKMPGKNIARPAPLTTAEEQLRGELKADVQTLAGEIGERNIVRWPQLKAAADFVEASFAGAGLTTRRDSYEAEGRACHNLEAEMPGSNAQIVLIGAHYDSVLGSPGANDNGSGVAAMLALARRFAVKPHRYTMRFVAFVNEEPPFFQTPQMGSMVYAQHCKAHGDRIRAVISLETIGYFSDKPGSQKYPAVGLGIFYPRVGNFIGFVGNVPSRALLRQVLARFREQKKLPSEGAALPAFVPGVGWSDQWAFWQHGYPGIMVTDTAPFRYPYYHSPDDTPDKLEYDRFTLVVSGLEKTIEEISL
jgi:Zn-dependent M28 family amino/carboxypeptidase